MAYKNPKDQEAWRIRHKAETRAYNRSYYADHREKSLKTSAAWRKNNRPHLQDYNRRKYREGIRERRDYSLRVKYGITLERYEEILAEQDGVCAICRKPPGRWMLAVDHDHVTGKIRGLLHGRCNMGLGQFDDDPDLLEAAATYLRSRK